MNKNIFEKYVLEKCSPLEIDSFFHQITNKTSSKNTINLFEKYWFACSDIKGFNSTDKEKQLDIIHHQINLRNVHSRRKHRRSIIISILSKAAILILIPILTIWLYTSYYPNDNTTTAVTNTVFNEIISPIGSRIKLDLSDGTRVWLNHGSKLIYPQQFNGSTRTVKLTGEGYFEVFHNPDKLFVVETKDMQVIALGTSFNVNAYLSDNTMETTLESGRVILKDYSNQSFELKPGQQISWSIKDNTAAIRSIDTKKYVSWKDGKLVFKDDSFVNIANRLERWYNVDIEIQDPKIKELTYTATFIDEPLYQILEMLEIVSPIKCHELERTVLSDGTYSRKKNPSYINKLNLINLKERNAYDKNQDLKDKLPFWSLLFY